LKRVMIISFTDLGRDPRVYRQIQFLKNNYRVTAVGTGDPGVEEVEFIRLDLEEQKKNHVRRAWNGLKLLLRFYKKRYWQDKRMVQIRERLQDLEMNLIIANDLETLPLALAIAGEAKVIFDAHEYSPGQFEHSFVWRLFFQDYTDYLCKKYIPQVDAMMTVCEGIARQYEKIAGVKPVVITNAPFFHNLEPVIPKSTNVVRIIHHGHAIFRRKLDKLILMMDFLDDRFELHFLLQDSEDDCLDQLRRLAEGKSNIVFHDPVPMRKMPEHLNEYDIGIFILEPNTFNHRFVLPNKLFEFIQARLAVAIGPSLEMAALVREYDCGLVAADFSPQTMAKCLLELDHEKLLYYKRNSDRAARQLNADNNRLIVIDLVKQVLNEA
jgi:hypothetical protein